MCRFLLDVNKKGIGQHTVQGGNGEKVRLRE